MFELCELHGTRSDPAFRWQCQEADFAVELLGSRLGVGVEVYVATKLLKDREIVVFVRDIHLWGTSACERYMIYIYIELEVEQAFPILSVFTGEKK